MGRGFWIGMALIVALLAGGITWAVIADNRWQHACSALGGHDEQRFEYYQTTYNANGTIQSIVPIYSDHCIVNGAEVKA